MQRPLLLTGFRGAGKSSLGRLIARRLKVPLIDLTARTEAERQSDLVGATTCAEDPAVVAGQQQQLGKVLDAGQPQVVALGVDTLLDREVRLRAIDEAVVVALQASAATLARRSEMPHAGDSASAAQATSQVGRLLELRREADAEAHARVSTEAVELDQLAAKVLEVWSRDALAVAAGSRSYTVETGQGIAAARLPEVVVGSPRTLLITDSNVAPLYADHIQRALETAATRVCRIVLAAGEQHKNVASLQQIWEAALGAGADRGSLVVGLGGGVVTDVAGLAAATWMRGVRWTALPTTLLAMVDASVGGKTAVDLPRAKNAVGAFWQPTCVVCDVDFIATEPARGYRGALAEVVKTALIGDPELLHLIEGNVDAVNGRDPKIVAEMVRRCIRVKARVVSRDERESGLRACLNLGHTVGHALEAQGGYAALTHGEAVSLGLVAALRIGERLGLTPSSLAGRTGALLGALGLPVQLDAQALAEASRLLGHDKKRAGSQLKFVVARDAGKVETVRLGLEELRQHTQALA